ncbi:MAG: 50S ribosomal protein L9 [Alphaproteobacteria bacterium 16-39-46]|nr:MAG: 50S ribosomal protein L9 [Alphaproteobacteria bacterium 16-39-46]OZA43487.1 MAG: 50S ribosomal protein L9 [Alphaproteobacteria bacterium 17-39-52]HQS84326.1 50S ribosomal protein L9 [Alphaproteobacteria bacterium]HQS94152.1 50S ribosomal protein L9 [Alphaproteobacteria bacterium]
MKVILLERVPSLGQIGSVVEVKPGYARNFLLPKKKALRVTPENMAIFEKQKGQLEAVNLTKKSEAEDAALKIQGLSITLIRQAGDSGHLYGSVTPRDISVILMKKGIEIKKSQIVLKAPIKEIGISECDLILHPEVVVPLTLVVAQSEEEAQAKMSEQKLSKI